MDINMKFIKEDLCYINSLRQVLYTRLYNDPTCIEFLRSILAENISCISIEFNEINKFFILKIKKTEMKKMHKFSNIAEYYYKLIPIIFSKFIERYKDDIIVDCMKNNIDPVRILNAIKNNSSILMDICNLSCMSDNIVIINI